MTLWLFYLGGGSGITRGNVKLIKSINYIAEKLSPLNGGDPLSVDGMVWRLVGNPQQRMLVGTNERQMTEWSSVWGFASMGSDSTD